MSTINIKKLYQRVPVKLLKEISHTYFFHFSKMYILSLPLDACCTARRRTARLSRNKTLYSRDVSTRTFTGGLRNNTLTTKFVVISTMLSTMLSQRHSNFLWLFFVSADFARTRTLLCSYTLYNGRDLQKRWNVPFLNAISPRKVCKTNVFFLYFMTKKFGIITHTQNNKDYIKNSLISLTRNIKFKYFLLVEIVDYYQDKRKFSET